MLPNALKAFVAWLQEQWTETEIIWKGQAKEPSGTAWLRVYILRELGRAAHSDSRESDILFNFSIFNTDLANLYTLNELEEKLREVIENKKLCFDSGTLEFFEFDSTGLDETNSQQVKVQKELEYKSIMVSAHFLSAKK